MYDTGVYCKQGNVQIFSSRFYSQLSANVLKTVANFSVVYKIHMNNNLGRTITENEVESVCKGNMIQDTAQLVARISADWCATAAWRSNALVIRIFSGVFTCLSIQFRVVLLRLCTLQTIQQAHPF